MVSTSLNTPLVPGENGRMTQVCHIGTTATLMNGFICSGALLSYFELLAPQRCSRLLHASEVFSHQYIREIRGPAVFQMCRMPYPDARAFATSKDAKSKYLLARIRSTGLALVGGWRCKTKGSPTLRVVAWWLSLGDSLPLTACVVWAGSLQARVGRWAHAVDIRVGSLYHKIRIHSKLNSNVVNQFGGSRLPYLYVIAGGRGVQIGMSNKWGV